MGFQRKYLKDCCSFSIVSVINLSMFCIVLLLMLYSYHLKVLSMFPSQVNLNKGKKQTITHFSEIGLRGYHTNQVGSTERPDRCNNCFYRPYRFIINSLRVCKFTTVIDLLVLIHTRPRNKLHRNLIRGTWAKSMNKNISSRVRYIFLIGNSSHNHQIWKENKLFGDLILQDFMDSYLNLTLKTLMGFEWGRNFCPQAKMIMKTDDDVLVNVQQILLLIHDVKYQTDLVYGDCYKNNTPVRNEPIQKNLRKFYTPFWRYPHQIYPPYCRGIGYIISAQNVDGILSISSNIPFFEWEDVYIGLCLKALGSKVQNIKKFQLSVQPIKGNNCINYKKTKWYITTFSNISKARKSWYKCKLPLLRNTK